MEYMENDMTRRDAAAIFQAALRAVDPYRLVREQADSLASFYHDERCGRIILIGFGKAAFPMTRALSDALPHMIGGGILITKDGHLQPHPLPAQIAIREAAHPCPDARGVQATNEALRLIRTADQATLLVCLVSGGGSALLIFPLAGISLQDKQEITELLLKAGADIGELNAVRKHLSCVKGGRLMETAYPAKVASLILSDVIGDPLDVIASGPTAPDGTTFSDALDVIERHALTDRIPVAGLDLLRRGARGEIPETPKAGNPIFNHCQNIIIGSNKTAILAAEAEAARQGYKTAILTCSLRGEARDAGRRLARESVAAYQETVRTGSGKRCLIAGGETTVTVTGGGLGGAQYGTGPVLRPGDKGTSRHYPPFRRDGRDGWADGRGRRHRRRADGCQGGSGGAERPGMPGQ